MIIQRLEIRRLRCLADVSLELAPGLNAFIGDNGAGKSSLVEAVHLLGYGRSFRGRIGDGVIMTGAPALEVVAQWQDGSGASHQAGLRHGGANWEARLDGAGVTTLADLCARFPVATFEPGSHELLAGGAEYRRRFLDWGLFHVERGFLPVWRRYSRALRQRNALLKTHPSPLALAPWDQELAESGEVITRLRAAYLQQLEPVLSQQAAAYLREPGALQVEFLPGWRRSDLTLADALLLNRERDLSLGYTTVGAHRADWRLAFENLPAKEALSRGQQKLAALACILGQAGDLAVQLGEWPVICLDDLASELDASHQAQVLSAVLSGGAQVLLTGTQLPASVGQGNFARRLFHVEQGAVTIDLAPPSGGNPAPVREAL